MQGRYVTTQFLWLALLLLCGNTMAMAATFDSKHHRFSVSVLADKLDHPWGMAFLPDGGFLVTERSGGLKRITDDGQVIDVAGLPDIVSYGQGGLLDVTIDPRFADNRLIYLSYVAAGQGGLGTEALRARLSGERLSEVSVIFRMAPKVDGGRHFGSRMVWLPDNTLLLSLGDRAYRERAQSVSDHIGTIVRITPSGEVPDDNPFVGRANARPEIFSYGHRNVQGIVRGRQDRAGLGDGAWTARWRRN